PGDARRSHLHEELAHALVLWRRGIGARDQVAVVRRVRVGRPDRVPVDDEDIAVRGGARTQRGEVRSRVGLAHADAEDELAARDSWQDIAPLLLRAVGEQRGSDLTVGEPVRAHRRARAQQLLGDDQPLEVGPFLAAVAAWPRVADPPARTERAGALARETDDPAVVA